MLHPRRLGRDRCTTAEAQQWSNRSFFLTKALRAPVFRAHVRFNVPPREFSSFRSA